MHSRVVGSVTALALVLGMVALAFVAFAPPARASPDTVPWTSLTRVNYVNGYSDSWPVVLGDNNGHFYVFYLQLTNATSVTNVRVAKFNDVGIFGTPAFVFDHQVNDVSNVAASDILMGGAIDHSGNIYIAWTRTDPTLNDEFYVSKSVDGGSTWEAAVRANAPNAYGNDDWGQIAIAPDGTIYAAWLQAWGGFRNISVSKSTDGGATFGDYQNISGDPTTQSVGRLAIAVDSTGRVYVAYEDYIFTNGYTGTALSWSDDGITWSPKQMVSAPNTEAVVPQVAVDSQDHVHVTYATLFGGSLRTLYTTSADRGVTWSTPVFIDQGISGPDFIPSLALRYGTLVQVAGSTVGTEVGFEFLVSSNLGQSWYPEQFIQAPRMQEGLARTGADENGTFYSAYVGTDDGIYAMVWNGPPSTPVLTSVASGGAGSLTVTWNPVPELNVAEYQVWRSTGGAPYQLVGTVSAPATSFTDTGLGNGTYSYEVVAVNTVGSSSAASIALQGTVGPSMVQLQQEITNLQNQLNSANANLGAIQTQLNNLKNQVGSVQGNTTALQNQINSLQNQLNTAQTLGYASLAFEIIVVVLLVVVLLNQMRKPKSPQLMMAQPGQVAPSEPRKPEDDL